MRKMALHAAVGTGKTVMATQIMWDGTYDWCDVPRWIVVAPKMVAATVWPDNFKRWEHCADFDYRHLTFDDLGLTKNRGTLQFKDKAATKRRLQSYREQVHICSWEAFPWIMQAYGKNMPYQGGVLDEADFVKDQGSERSRAARWLAKSVKSLIELTATPIANGYQDIWHPMFLMDGGQRLGRTLTEFHETWCEPDKKNWSTGQIYSWRVRPELIPEIDRLIGELVIAVPSNLGVPLLEVDAAIEMPDSARQVYVELERELIVLLDSGEPITAPNPAVLRGKLLQVCQGAVYGADGKVQKLHDVKLDRLESLLDEIKEPVLLAYHYIHDAERIKARLKARVAFLSDAAGRAQWEKGERQVLAFHPKSGAHGLDGLQHVSRHVIWLGVDEDLALYQQMNGRLHRTGQEKTVIVHRLIAENSIERRIVDQVLPGKAALQDGLLLRSRHNVSRL